MVQPTCHDPPTRASARPWPTRPRSPSSCSGSAQAAELARKYEPVIRMEVRLRLGDPRLQRLVDTMDICQSVLASFFVRAASGEYDLDEPRQLTGLLVVMARNKVAHQARRQRARRRDVAPGPDGWDFTDPDPGPSRVVAGRELLDEFRARLTVEERRLADLRAEGREWAEIAAELGGTAGARRKQFARKKSGSVHKKSGSVQTAVLNRPRFFPELTPILPSDHLSRRSAPGALGPGFFVAPSPGNISEILSCITVDFISDWR
jgi:DNA-directed RNA polymerase specialized sigma24 family protein